MRRVDLLSHNWLGPKINNESFKRHFSLIRGCVIDLGCGTAPYKEDIIQVAKYIGVDWKASPNQKRRVDVIANLSDPFPFEDDLADTVISFQTLEHIPEPGYFLSEIYRILRPGGSLFLIVPFSWHVHEAPFDYFRFTRYGLEYLLKKNHFERVSIEENTGFWQMWVLKFNYYTTRVSFGPFRLMWVPIWLVVQAVACLLDKIIDYPRETSGYTVIAKK